MQCIRCRSGCPASAPGGARFPRRFAITCAAHPAWLCHIFPTRVHSHHISPLSLFRTSSASIAVQCVLTWQAPSLISIPLHSFPTDQTRRARLFASISPSPGLSGRWSNSRTAEQRITCNGLHQNHQQNSASSSSAISDTGLCGGLVRCQSIVYESVCVCVEKRCICRNIQERFRFILLIFSWHAV